MTTTNNAVMAGERRPSAHTGKNKAPGKSLGLYIHIPFCMRKCNYCDFLSFGGIPEEVREAYFRTLIRELGYYGRLYRKDYYVDSIFIGGGTPSLVEDGLIGGLMQAVRDSFTVSDNAEISIESNPKTLTKRKLKTYLDSGINRLSIGAQSLDDELLDRLGRAHSAEDFLAAYFLARESGFQNINIDLIFAIPGQSMESWRHTLERVLGLAPEHISFYSLQIEEGTVFYDLFREGRLQAADDELDRNMYHTAVKMLEENGFLHYEISNAAKPGRQCRHNLKYWSMEDYLGLGLGAHSFLGGTRFGNVTDLNEYMQAGNGDSAERSPFTAWNYQNTANDNISEYLITGMRKIGGIDLADFEERFGVALESLHAETLERYRKQGLIEVRDNCLRFTKKGIDISNRVLVDFV